MTHAKKSIFVSLLLLAVYLATAVIGEHKASATAGTSLHEWMGLLAAAGLVVHLVLYRKQIIRNLQRFIQRDTKQKVFSILEVLILGMVLLTVLSGVLISESLGFGQVRTDWRLLHHLFPKLILLFVFLHVALSATKIKAVLLAGMGRKPIPLSR